MGVKKGDLTGGRLHFYPPPTHGGYPLSRGTAPLSTNP